MKNKSVEVPLSRDDAIIYEQIALSQGKTNFFHGLAFFFYSWGAVGTLVVASIIFSLLVTLCAILLVLFGGINLITTPSVNDFPH